MEYPVAIIVISDEFKAGDRTANIDSIRNGYINFFKITESEANSKHFKDNPRLKIVWDNPDIKKEYFGQRMLKDITVTNTFTYNGSKYRKTIKSWNSDKCPKYLGEQQKDAVVIGCMPEVGANTNSYATIDEYTTWINENTLVQPE